MSKRWQTHSKDEIEPSDYPSFFNLDGVNPLLNVCQQKVGISRQKSVNLAHLTRNGML